MAERFFHVCKHFELTAGIDDGQPMALLPQIFTRSK